MRLYYRLPWSIVRVFATIYCRLRISGTENIPATGGFIVASNHIAGGDPPFVSSAVKRELYFLAKKELFRNFFLRILITSLNSIPVNRGVFDWNALVKAEKALKGGYGLILFPEGTRSKTGELGSGKPGVGMLARKAMVPIVPAYIENSRGFWKIPFSGRRIKVSFGPPILPARLAAVSDDKEGYRNIVKEVMEAIASLKAASESLPKTPVKR